MATSGSTTVKVTNYNNLKFNWSIQSQSIVNNYSTVNWSLQLVSVTNGKIISSTSKTWTVVVNGTTYTGSTSIAINDNQTITLASGSTVISHNTDGSKTFSYSFSQAFNITFGGVSIGTISGSGSGVLTAIPRTSTLTIPSITIGSEGTLTINTSSTSFTHTITAKIGSYSSTLATKTSNTSIKFTPPLTWCNAIPNATSGLATYTIDTYNGSTLIGSKVYTAPLTIPASIVPTIGTISQTETVSGLATKFGAYVLNQSRVKFTIMTSGAYSSTISSIVTTFDGATYYGSEFTTGIIRSTSGIATVKITDSRGRSATKAITISALNYSAPMVYQLDVNRSKPDGTIDDEGSSLLIQYYFGIYTLNNKNDKSYKLEIKSSSDTTYKTVASGNTYSLSNSLVVSEGVTSDESYLVKLTISDYFYKNDTAITKEVDAPTGFTLVDYHKSGKGMAFGKVSQREGAVEVALDLYDKYDTQIRNGLVFYESGGTTDANTTIEELFLTRKNTPDDNSYWCIRQIFYGGKTATTSRIQIAEPHSAPGKGRYRRTYVEGSGWTAWVNSPIIVAEGTSGIWTYRKWSNGIGECEGKIAVNSININTALASWYRSDLISGGNYPFTFTSIPNINAQFYTTNSNGGMVWATTVGTASTAPSYYILRPNTATGVSGAIHIQVKGGI